MENICILNDQELNEVNGGGAYKTFFATAGGAISGAIGGSEYGTIFGLPGMVVGGVVGGIAGAYLAQ